jgi:hypothetical protein
MSLLLFLLLCFAHIALSSSSQSLLHHLTSDRNLSFIFTSLHGLLRQLPNTLSPNGFSLAVGTIPAYTILYHARKDAGAIPRIDWLAFDAEMSYGIMGGQRGDTWLHTFATTRSVKVLVFDGMSAAIRTGGTLDSQMLFLYGKVPDEARNAGEPEWSDKPEFQRAAELCAWAQEHGGGEIEGFVRMNTGFEVLWCDFETLDSGLKLVSKLNVTALSSLSRRGLPWANAAGWEWIRSAAWHFTAPEQRVIPDYCRFFTFYDPAFVSFPSNLTTRKNLHRLTGVTKSDATAFKTQIAQSIHAITMPCSGLDWRRVTQDIMDRYGARIHELSLVSTVERAREIAFAGVMPFLGERGEQERCRSAYTKFLTDEMLSPQEHLLKDSVEIVLERICGLFLEVYFDDVRWREKARELMMWLDWGVWRSCGRCNEKEGEVCVPGPMWPVLGLMDWEEWEGMRCVNRSIVERHG